MPHDEFEIVGCHTVGMLVQTYAESDPDVSFVAYHAVHPLERRIAVKIATHRGSVSDALGRVMHAVHRDIDRVLDALREGPEEMLD